MDEASFWDLKGKLSLTSFLMCCENMNENVVFKFILILILFYFFEKRGAA